MSIHISKNIDDLSRYVADWMVNFIQETLRTKDRFTIALSGGSTPKKLHLLLASTEYRDRIDWEKLHVFFGDERYVPLTDERSNAKMAFDTLLDHVPVPPSQIHVMRTDIEPQESAAEYELVLDHYFPGAASYKLQAASETKKSENANITTFDLVLLGLGDNAHTLSLFPGEEVIHEKKSWVRSVYVKEINMERITLTAPVVNLSGKVAFLVSGQEKSEAISHVLLNSYSPDLYPAQVIKPVNGELIWFLDEAAAGRLKKSRPGI